MYVDLDKQNLLLMYLAGELSQVQHQRVEEMLETDSALRMQLEQLRSAHGLIADGLAALDASEPPPVSSEVAARRVGRSIAQWQVDRLIKPAAAMPAIQRSGLSWLRYGAAAAAMLLVGVLVVWSLVPDDKLPSRVDAVADRTGERGNQSVTTEDDEVLVATLIAPPEVRTKSGEALDDVEREIYALATMSSPNNEQEATP